MTAGRWMTRAAWLAGLLLLGSQPLLAQAPAPAPAPPPATSEAKPDPAKTDPAKPDPANPPAAQPPAQPPAAAEAPVTPPPAPAPPPAAQAADSFGEEITLAPRKALILKGSATWDAAFETLVDSFKSLTALLDKQGLKPAGNLMVVYTSTDDSGFTFLAEAPVDQEPKSLGKNMTYGSSPEGKALKFVHRGSYDNMDNTYEAITNHLDDRKLEAKDMFIEEYVTDPLKTAEDKLVINVYVPLR